MISVCIPFSSSGEVQKNWDYLLSNFKPSGTVYVIGNTNDVLPNTNVMGQSTFITSYDQLPLERTLVFLAPENGRYIQGKESLLDFKHPDNVIYIVGPNNTLLNKESFGELVYSTVYIPTDTTDEMFNWTALAVTLYDRKIKQWLTR